MAAEPRNTASRFRSVTARLRWIVIVGAAALLLADILLDPFARQYLENRLCNTLSTRVEVQDVSVGILSGTVDVGRITVYDPTGPDGEEAVTLDGVHCSLSLVDALGRAPRLGTVVLRHPEITLDAHAGRVNLLVLLRSVRERASGRPETARARREGGAPRRLRVDVVRLEDLMLQLDESVSREGGVGVTSVPLRSAVPGGTLSFDALVERILVHLVRLTVDRQETLISESVLTELREVVGDSTREG